MTGAFRGAPGAHSAVCGNPTIRFSGTGLRLQLEAGADELRDVAAGVVGDVDVHDARAAAVFYHAEFAEDKRSAFATTQTLDTPCTSAQRPGVRLQPKRGTRAPAATGMSSTL